MKSNRLAILILKEEIESIIYDLRSRYDSEDEYHIALKFNSDIMELENSIRKLKGES